MHEYNCLGTSVTLSRLQTWNVRFLDHMDQWTQSSACWLLWATLPGKIQSFFVRHWTSSPFLFTTLEKWDCRKIWKSIQDPRIYRGQISLNKNWWEEQNLSRSHSFTSTAWHIIFTQHCEVMRFTFACPARQGSGTLNLLVNGRLHGAIERQNSFNFKMHYLSSLQIGKVTLILILHLRHLEITYRLMGFFRGYIWYESSPFLRWTTQQRCQMRNWTRLSTYKLTKKIQFILFLPSQVSHVCMKECLHYT